MRKVLFLENCLARSRLFLLSLLGLLFASDFLLPRDTAATAQSFEPAGLNQLDLDGDALPDLTIINVSLATNNDEIHVYDGGNDMRWGKEWSTVTDFVNDTWVFDIGADGSAQLVIQFSKTAYKVKASLFHDLDGDGEVSIDIVNGLVNVTESAYPPLTMVAEPDWYLANGQLNWNIHILSDGPSVEHINTYNLSTTWRRFVQLDGEPDIEIEFRDDDLDGIPEYGLWRLLAPTPKTEGGSRTWIWSNEAQHIPDQPGEFEFWPFLGSSEANGYFDTPPIIEVDWLASRIARVSFPGYPIEHGYHVNTIQDFKKNLINYADFENIQAYYDLANNEDGNPELHIRHRYFGSFDPYGWNLPEPVNEIRWSWNQLLQGDLTWDFKLGLAGRHEITSTISFPDFSYKTIPFDKLPSWIAANKWDMATFVAREGANFASSEGIYAWGPIESMLDDEPSTMSRYLAGQRVVDPRQAFQNIGVGWRGEFAPSLAGQPRLYFSPIDRRLHLLNAEYGIWTIDDRSQIRYSDRDGDGYIDHWRYEEDSELLEQLIFADQYLIYADDNQISLRQIDLSPYTFESSPPKNHREWRLLNDLLTDHTQELDTSDLENIATQFSGPEWRLYGGAIRDYRSTGDGFRFVLTLKTGFETTGLLENLDLLSHSPGEYLVTYDGSFSLATLKPPEISIEKQQLYDPGSISQVNSVVLEMFNNGLDDTSDLTLFAEAQTDFGIVKLDELAVDVLSGQPVRQILAIGQMRGGDWTLHAWLEDQDGTILAEVQEYMPPIGQGDSRGEFQMLVTTGRGWLIAAFLILVVTSAMVMGSIRFLSASSPVKKQAE